MIELPRVLARDFRAVLRRSLADVVPRGPLPNVICRTGPGGRSLEATSGELAIRHAIEGDFPVGELAFPGSALAAFEGSANTPVQLGELGPGRGRAIWTEFGAARSADFPTVSATTVAHFPEVPASLTAMPDGFVAALGEAALTTADGGARRFALMRVQLSGRSGEVIATDGRQLLVQGGFALPWPDVVLVPRMPAFAGRLLAGVKPIAVGRADSRVFVRAGQWTFALPIDTAARFPDAREVIPRPSGRSTRMQVDPEDAVLLVKALPGLAGKEDAYRPVTLELAPRPAVRSRSAEGGPTEEITLRRSVVTGPPLRIATDRRYLLRALRLGFTELEVGPGDRPLVCRHGQRIYLWMLHSAKDALPPTSGPIPQTASSELPSTPALENKTSLSKRKPAVAQSTPPSGSPNRNGTPAPASANGSSEVTIEALLAEGESLRGQLHEAHNRLGKLLVGLRQHRRQAKAVESALASLRPFQRAAGGSP